MPTSPGRAKPSATKATATFRSAVAKRSTPSLVARHAAGLDVRIGMAAAISERGFRIIPAYSGSSGSASTIAMVSIETRVTRLIRSTI